MSADQPSDLRERLIAAALTTLERGDEVGLRAVARDVGVSAMAPYRHFHDKSALLAAVAKLGFEDLRVALLCADSKRDTVAALVAQGEAYLSFARARPALFRLMFTGGGGQLPPVEDTAYGIMVKRVMELRPPDPDAATLACWAVVHGLATLALDGVLPPGGANRERAALRLAVAGLGSSSHPRAADKTPLTPR